MAKFYVVLYDFHTKKDTEVVPEEWIFTGQEDKGVFGTRCFLFYHQDKNIRAPETGIAVNFLRDSVKHPTDGFLYPGLVLKGFRKY
jgi:hypothetical protein